MAADVAIPPRVACYMAMMNTRAGDVLVRDYLSDLWRQALFSSMDYYRRPCSVLLSDVETLAAHATQEDEELAGELTRVQVIARKAAAFAVVENVEQMNEQLLLLKEELL